MSFNGPTTCHSTAFAKRLLGGLDGRGEGVIVSVGSYVKAHSFHCLPETTVALLLNRFCHPATMRVEPVETVKISSV